MQTFFEKLVVGCWLLFSRPSSTSTNNNPLDFTPLFCHFYSVNSNSPLTRAKCLSLYQKFTETRIQVLLTSLGCHPISFSCCIFLFCCIFLVVIGATNGSRFIIRIALSYYRFFLKWVKFSLYYTLKCWKISNFQCLTWQSEFFNRPR